MFSGIHCTKRTWIQYDICLSPEHCLLHEVKDNSKKSASDQRHKRPVIGMRRLGFCYRHQEREDSKGNPKLSSIDSVVVDSHNNEGSDKYTRTAFKAASELAMEESSLVIQCSSSVLMFAPSHSNGLGQSISNIIHGNRNKNDGLGTNDVNDKELEWEIYGKSHYVFSDLKDQFVGAVLATILAQEDVGTCCKSLAILAVEHHGEQSLANGKCHRHTKCRGCIVGKEVGDKILGYLDQIAELPRIVDLDVIAQNNPG